ncbi:3'-5' exonuclease [Mesorhizobium sp. M0808]|uniref:3'-5' exonuclease n=1 Tax=Mesorhizobium sp. M0808 TaxID=2957002 RepID=UPI00333BC9CA
MTKYAIFDTETNGFFIFKDADGKPVPADHPSQPRLAQLGIVLLDDNLVEERAIDLFVKPDGWEMTPEATAANGLTTEFLQEHGASVLDVLDQYARVVDAGYVMVAYHAQFDCKQMRGELRRAALDDRFEKTLNICLMRSSMKLGVKKASGKGGYPKLSDICAHFGITNQRAHDAGCDARATADVFRKMLALGILPEPAIHYAKNHPDQAAA